MWGSSQVFLFFRSRWGRGIKILSSLPSWPCGVSQGLKSQARNGEERNPIGILANRTVSPCCCCLSPERPLKLSPSSGFRSGATWCLHRSCLPSRLAASFSFCHPGFQSCLTLCPVAGQLEEMKLSFPSLVLCMHRAVDASGTLLPYFWTLPFNTSLYIPEKTDGENKKKYRQNGGKFIRGQEKISSGHSKAHKGDDCF